MPLRLRGRSVRKRVRVIALDARRRGFRILGRRNVDEREHECFARGRRRCDRGCAAAGTQTGTRVLIVLRVLPGRRGTRHAVNRGAVVHPRHIDSIMRWRGCGDARVRGMTAVRRARGAPAFDNAAVNCEPQTESRARYQEGGARYRIPIDVERSAHQFSQRSTTRMHGGVMRELSESDAGFGRSTSVAPAGRGGS